MKTAQSEKFNWFKMFWAGFSSMGRLGKTLWTLVIIKLIIMFLILKPLFFPKTLSREFDNDIERSQHVAIELRERMAEVD